MGPVHLLPPLPPEKLKRIDLTSNFISWADVDAFRLLPSLQELILPENRLTALPELPRSIIRLDARLNRIPSTGLRPEAFRVGAGTASPVGESRLVLAQTCHAKGSREWCREPEWDWEQGSSSLPSSRRT